MLFNNLNKRDLPLEPSPVKKNILRNVIPEKIDLNIVTIICFVPSLLLNNALK